MPRGDLKDTVSIDKAIFKKILKLKGYKMKNLYEIIQTLDSDYICSDRTLKRSLDNGTIRSVYLNKIAKKINFLAIFIYGTPNRKIYIYYYKILFI